MRSCEPTANLDDGVMVGPGLLQLMGEHRNGLRAIALLLLACDEVCNCGRNAGDQVSKIFHRIKLLGKHMRAVVRHSA